MICPKCTSVMPDTNRFCTQCGCRLQVELNTPEPKKEPLEVSDSFAASEEKVFEPFKPAEVLAEPEPTAEVEPEVPAEPDPFAPIEQDEPKSEPSVDPFAPIEKEEPETPPDVFLEIEPKAPANERFYEDTIVLDPFFPEDDEEEPAAIPAAEPFAPIDTPPVSYGLKEEPEALAVMSGSGTDNKRGITKVFGDAGDTDPFAAVAAKTSDESEMTEDEFLKDYLSDSTRKKVKEDNDAKAAARNDYTNILYTQPPEPVPPVRKEPPAKKEPPAAPPQPVRKDPPVKKDAPVRKEPPAVTPPPVSTEHSEPQDITEEGSFTDSLKDKIAELDDEKLKKLIILGIIALLALALIVYGIKLIVGGGSNDDAQDPGQETTQDDSGDTADDQSEDTGDEGTDDSGETPSASEKVSAAGLKRVAYDINYSQADDINGSGVDFLIQVENSNDYAINSVIFKYYQDDEAVINTLDTTDSFLAYGYIKPHSTGYMYCRMHVPSNTEKSRGKIKIKGAYTVDMGDYEMPSGTIEERTTRGSEDYYDVDITNNNDIPVSNNSKIIAICEGGGSKNYPLANAWGCGDLDEEIAANDSAYVTHAIENPGMDGYSKSSNRYVFVIDRDALGIFGE